MINVSINSRDYKEEYSNIIQIAKVNGYDRDLVEKKNSIAKNVLGTVATRTKQTTKNSHFIQYITIDSKKKNVQGTLAVQNKLKIKTLIKGNHKKKELNNIKSGLLIFLI